MHLIGESSAIAWRGRHLLAADKPDDDRSTRISTTFDPPTCEPVRFAAYASIDRGHSATLSRRGRRKSWIIALGAVGPARSTRRAR